MEMRRSNTSWILANLNVTGYYRVNYDLENWEGLLGQLGSDPQVDTQARCSVAGVSGDVFSGKMAPSSGSSSHC